MAKPISVDAHGRICNGCGTFKIWECFDKKRDGLSGRHSQCKDCVGKFKRCTGCTELCGEFQISAEILHLRIYRKVENKSLGLLE